MQDKISFLFIGDIIGKIGRKCVNKVVPNLKNRENIDIIIANIENIAHGKGITKKVFNSIKDSKIDFYTSGNHFFDRKGYEEVLKENKNVLRPANYPPKVLGKGFLIFEYKGVKVLLINLIGRVFMNNLCDCPFRKFDEIYDKYFKKVDLVIVDFHAEASSEKNTFSYYVNGRANAVIGTHTHIPTCDLKKISDKTFYVTDVGMVGDYEGVIGIEKQGPIKFFLTNISGEPKIKEKGKCVFNSIKFEISKFGEVLSFKRIDLIKIIN